MRSRSGAWQPACRSTTRVRPPPGRQWPRKTKRVPVRRNARRWCLPLASRYRRSSAATFPARARFTVPIPDGRVLDLGGRPLVMGILNVTPDSFAETRSRLDPARAVDAALEMEAQGADVIDVGGESTRPGSDPLPASDELARLLPVLAGLVGQLRVPLSVDTYKADVARAALDAGASLVNDVSGLRYDPLLARVVAGRGAAIVLMHTRGRPKTMYSDAVYDDVV